MTITEALELGLLCEVSLVSLTDDKKEGVKEVMYRDSTELLIIISEVSEINKRLVYFEDFDYVKLDSIKKVELFLFDIFEEEKLLDDNSLKLSNEIPIIIISHLNQISFLKAKMEGAKDKLLKVKKKIECHIHNINLKLNTNMADNQWKVEEVEIADIIKCKNMDTDMITAVVAVVNPLKKDIIGVKEAIKETIIDPAKQTYILDPQNNVEISWKEAIDKHLIIAYEIKNEMLTAQLTECLITSNIEEFMNIEDMEILGVLKTDDGNILEVKRAEEENILDLKLCVFRDILNDQWLPLKQAILKGLVLIKLKNTDDELHRVYVDHVGIGKDQIKVSLKDAIDDKYIDTLTNIYQIKEENIEMELMDAIKCGLIEVMETPEEHKMDHERFLVIHRKKNDPEIKELHQYEMKTSMNVKIISKVQESDCWNEFVKINGKKESFVESIYNDHLELDPLRCGEKSKESVLISCVKGNISIDKMINLLKNMKELFVGEKIECLENVSKGEDIENKLSLLTDMDKKDIFVISCETMDIMSTDKLEEHRKNESFIIRINTEDVHKKLIKLKALEDIGIDTNMNVITKKEDESGMYSMTMMEAVMNDIMLLDSLEIMDGSDGKMYGLEESVKMRLIDGKSAENLFDFVDKFSFDKLVDEGIFNAESNSFGEEVSLLKAIENEVVEPTLTYLFVPHKNEFVNLSKLMKDGILDGETNEVTMETKEGEMKTMKLSEAIKNESGMLLAKIDVSGRKKKIPKTLKKVKDENDLNYDKDKVIFGALDNKEMTITEALELGLLCEDSLVMLCECIDNNLNIIMFLDNVTLLKFINDVNEMLEKLSSFENLYVKSQKKTLSFNNEDDQMVDLDILLFTVLEEEKELEDKIEVFTDSIKSSKEDANIIQSSFLVAQMENVRNLSSNISHYIQKSQNVPLKGDVVSCVVSTENEINQTKLKLNNINRDIQKIMKLKSSSSSKNLSMEDLTDYIKNIKENENEVSMLSPKICQLKDYIMQLFDRNRSCHEDSQLKKITNIEKELFALKKLRDTVSSNIESLLYFFVKIRNNYNAFDQSLNNIEKSIKEMNITLLEESKHIPLNIELLENKFETICRLKRDISTLQQTFDKLDKNVKDDFKDTKLYKLMEPRMIVCLNSLATFKNDINDQQKNITQTKKRLDEIKIIANGIADLTITIEKSLNEMKLKQKTDSTFLSVIEVKKQFMDTISLYEQLRNSYDSYINNPLYVSKDKILSLRQNLTENHRELYAKINEELIFQVESIISLILMDLGRLQMFILDLPKSWNTNSKDVKMRISEIDNYLKYLKEMEKKLQNIEEVIGENLIEQLSINFDNIENAIVNIQFCEKERMTTQIDLEKILDIVCNSYLPTIVSFENSKQIAETTLADLSLNLESSLQEFNLFVNNDINKSSEDFENIMKDKKSDLQKLNEQLLDLESVVDSVESYGFDIIEQLINLTADYGTGSNLLPDIKEEVHRISQKLKDLKGSISDFDRKINDLITTNVKSLNEQVNEEMESWMIINDEINRLEPIQSRPEKIKEQEQETLLMLGQIKKKETEYHVFKQSINFAISEANENENIVGVSIDDISINTNPNYQSQEIADCLKDIEILIESIFYKVENRTSVIKDVCGISNNFWPEITSLNNTISEINKVGNVTEVFPNQADFASVNLARQPSEESESPSIVAIGENRSSTASVDMEIEGKIGNPDVTGILKDDLKLNPIKPELVSQQNELLTRMDNTVEECIEKLHNDLEPKAMQIIKVGGQSCAFEVSDFLEAVWENVGTAQDILGEKHIEIDKGLYLVNCFVEELKKISEWFPVMENRLYSINDVTPDQKMIELNINELKTLNAEVFSQFHKIDKLSSNLKEILLYPYLPNKSLLEEIKGNINERYDALEKAIMDKHSDLQARYLEIGELDFVLDDNIGIMQELENQIKHFTRQSSKGDPQYTTSCLKNLKLLSNAFEKQQIVIENLNEIIMAYNDSPEDVALISRGRLTIFGKLKEINDISNNIHEMIPEKEKLLEEILKNEKLLSKDIHKFIDYLDTVKGILKYSPKIGLTKESVDQFSSNYMNCIKDLSVKEESVRASIDMVTALLTNCPYEKCTSLTTAAKTLNYKLKRCVQLASKRKEKLNHYSQIILDFDKDKLMIFKEISDLDNITLSKMFPSKLTQTCYEQIKHIKITMQKTEKCLDVLESLNIRSFEIKCFGNKFDNSQLYLELKEYGLKLMKIQRCLRERLRIFLQAYKEDKLFSDSYDNLNYWLDESYIMVENFKQDPNKVQEHLEKLKKLCQQLSAQYANFHCTIRYGSYLKDRCLEADREKEILLEMLKNLRAKWVKIRNLIMNEKTNLNRKMIETGNLYDAIKCFSYWINDIISKFDPSMKIYGDLDTVEVLMLECQTCLDEADNHLKDFMKLKQRMLKEITNYEESDIRTTITDIETQFMEYLNQLKERKIVLKGSLEMAQDFGHKLDEIRSWTNKAEKQLKLKTLPKFQNESELISLIEKHEIFIKKLNEMKVVLDNLTNISKTILGNCHPSAKTYISRIIFIMSNHYSQIHQRANARSKKLNESLGSLRGSTALIEEMIQKVAEHITKIKSLANSKLPVDVESTINLNNNHIIFHNEIIQMDVQIKNLIKEFKVRNPSTCSLQDKGLRYRDRAEFYQNIWRNSKDNLSRTGDELTNNNRLNLLNSQFNVLWKLSVERKSSLQTRLVQLNEQELLKKFDFNTWRGDFIQFIKNKGLRLTDLFRKQSVKRTGFFSEEEFISCITKSGFLSNKAVLTEVFQLFNRNNDNMISYQEFIDSMRPERRSVDAKYKNVNMDDKKALMIIIHDIIEREVAKCTCRQRFLVKKEGDDKYRFGNNNKMYMVRYLNSSVMVRIGGGWQNLTEFLKIHDPCREKVSIQMSAGDQQKIKGLKLPPTPEGKVGTLTITKQKLVSDVKSSSTVNSPRSGRSSFSTTSSDVPERGKKDSLSMSLKSQPTKHSKLPTKK